MQISTAKFALNRMLHFNGNLGVNVKFTAVRMLAYFER